jgi:hypothetical protein
MRSRPLRSLLIGDVDHYASEYIFGVNQAMTLLGHWHATVNIRQDIGVIVRKVLQVQPDIIFGHMLLWAPNGQTDFLLQMCTEAKALWGTKVVIHDGDARVETRHPHDISQAVDLALCNHTVPREPWKIRQINWPYFAFVQKEIADSHPDFVCDLAFAGRRGGGIYDQRTQLLSILHARLGDRFKEFPTESVQHTLFRTAELAASAQAVLGYGRPDAPGWLDVRVFQYPGAGGVLLHDDTGGFLEPYRHFIPYERHNSDSILEALDQAKRYGSMIRAEAFAYVQSNHSSVARVRQVLREVDLSAH